MKKAKKKNSLFKQLCWRTALHRLIYSDLYRPVFGLNRTTVNEGEENSSACPPPYDTTGYNYKLRSIHRYDIDWQKSKQWRRAVVIIYRARRGMACFFLTNFLLYARRYGKRPYVCNIMYVIRAYRLPLLNDVRRRW